MIYVDSVSLKVKYRVKMLNGTLKHNHINAEDAKSRIIKKVEKEIILANYK